MDMKKPEKIFIKIIRHDQVLVVWNAPVPTTGRFPGSQLPTHKIAFPVSKNQWLPCPSGMRIIQCSLLTVTRSRRFSTCFPFTRNPSIRFRHLLSYFRYVLIIPSTHGKGNEKALFSLLYLLPPGQFSDIRNDHYRSDQQRYYFSHRSCPGHTANPEYMVKQKHKWYIHRSLAQHGQNNGLSLFSGGLKHSQCKKCHGAGRADNPQKSSAIRYRLTVIDEQPAHGRRLCIQKHRNGQGHAKAEDTQSADRIQHTKQKSLRLSRCRMRRSMMPFCVLHLPKSARSGSPLPHQTNSRALS